MARHNKSEGIVLLKKNILKDDKLIIIFTKDQGKMVFSARGIRTLTSHRSAHLETGNYIKFNYTTSNNFSHISETELIYGYSKIKYNKQKLEDLFSILFVLNKLLPENLAEVKVFNLTLDILKTLNNSDIGHRQIEQYYCEVLLLLGYLGQEQIEMSTFNVLQYLNENFNIKIFKN